MTDFSSLNGPQLVTWYNTMVARAFEQFGSTVYKQTQKFTDRVTGIKRCEALASSIRALEAGAAAADRQEAAGPQAVTDTAIASDGPAITTEDRHAAAVAGARSAMPAVAEVLRADSATTKKVATAKRGVGRPAGDPADFRAVRPGTARGRIVAACIKGVTLDQAARAGGVDRKMLQAHLACLYRDCAVGHKIEGERVTLVFPEGKGPADAFRAEKA